MVCFQILLNQFDKEETIISNVTINIRLVINAMKCKPTNVFIIKEVKKCSLLTVLITRLNVLNEFESSPQAI